MRTREGDVALRTRSTGAFSGSFWLSAVCAAFTPTSIGHQDLAAFFARQPGVSERWRDHLIASPFGTIHAATFSFSRPIGTAMPEPVGAQPVNFDPRSLDVKTWSGDELPMARPALRIEYPTVNRHLKGDRMPMAQSSPASNKPESVPQLQPIDGPASQPANPPSPNKLPRPKDAEQLNPASDTLQLEAVTEAFGSLPNAESQEPAPEQPAAVPTARLVPANADEQRETVAESVGSLPPAVPHNAELADSVELGSVTQLQRNEAHEADVEDGGVKTDLPQETNMAGVGEPLAAGSPGASLSFLDEDAADRNGKLYFGIAAMGSRSELEQWEPSAQPIAASPIAANIKLSALEPPANAGVGGETLPSKSEATWFKSPADRLSLTGKPRARAEKCIADAVYFEARGEPLRGQMAVAQVVMNRVFSGRYPNDVCGVVYQNAHRQLACQFTFACEGKDLSRIDEPDMWEQAKHIAKDALDGKIWLAEVGHATHYHAYWVRPSWVHEMAKLYKLGVHTFYRPRAWGDGSDSNWSSMTVKPKSVGAATQNPEAAKSPGAAMKSPEAAKTPQAVAPLAKPVAEKNVPIAKL